MTSPPDQISARTAREAGISKILVPGYEPLAVIHNDSVAFAAYSKVAAAPLTAQRCAKALSNRQTEAAVARFNDSARP